MAGKREMIGKFMALLALAVVAHGAEFHVAPTGDDANAGSLEKPFATVQRGQKSAGPGDTVFIRGGVYRMTEDQIARRRRGFAYITYLDKSGLPGKRISYRAFPGERPVFECSAVKPAGMRVDAFYVSGSWLHIEGLEVIGVQVTMTGHTQSIGFENDGSHNIFERLSIHDGQAIGIYSVRGSSNLFLNCDAWANWDYTSENGKGGNVDGFGGHPTKGGVGNVFRGCRAWFNSDDGFDCINSFESVTFENCWAFDNGMSTNRAKLGDGNGFKIGGYGSSPVHRLPSPIPRHVVRGCLAVGNRANGFYLNHHIAGNDWFNNTAYKNGGNFNMQGRLADNATEVNGGGNVLRNNVSYGNKYPITRFDPAKNEADHNTFFPEMKLSDRDFVSLDVSQLTRPRQPNGNLPVITLLHPAEGGALIDAGVDVGLPFRGARPDLGAFEH